MSMRILWIDDEIEELGSMISFLESQGLNVDTAKSTVEGIEKLSKNAYNLVLLDYRMPTINGLEALKLIKRAYPNIPVVMLTMITDEEVIRRSLIEDAYDYIVKPVQPAQILALISKLKKDTFKKETFAEEADRLKREIDGIPETFEGWMLKAIKIFQARHNYRAFRSKFDEILSEENAKFGRWIYENYEYIIRDETLPMSHTIMKRIILPSVEVSPVVIILLDNFRFDQMYEMVSELTSTYKIEQMMYMSILPTATQYSRNSLFAGRLPSEMEGMIPGVLSDNQNELKLLWNLLNEEKYRVQSWYSKVKDLGTLSGLKPYGRRLEVYVVNFVDMILHLTANIESLKSLGEGESSIKRWARLVVEDGRFGRVINRFVERGYQVYITSDHGWTVGTEPMKVDGEDISKGFRYKYGVNMSVSGEKFVGVEKPVRWGLPDWGKFIFATENGFFVWGERADEYAEIYKRKMFHGGISLEEMVLSVIRIRG